MAAVTLLLPPRSRFVGAGLPPAVSRALGQADRAGLAPGERAQARRHFHLIPDHWPVAALTREMDAGDAAGATWLRADPVHVVPDINGARMLAHGEALQLATQDASALLPDLKPLFGDCGFLLDAPTPSRWYLRLPKEARLPEFAEPRDVLGDDIFEHLPDGDVGRRWRALLSDAQVVLHNHPWNVARVATGRPPVNSLWFWGAGSLPDHVESPYSEVHASDPMLAALAHAAGVLSTEPPVLDGSVDAVLHDLHEAGTGPELVARWLSPVIAAVRQGRLASATLDFADGERLVLTPSQRWRFWRRPLHKLDP